MTFSGSGGGGSKTTGGGGGKVVVVVVVVVVVYLKLISSTKVQSFSVNVNLSINVSNVSLML